MTCVLSPPSWHALNPSYHPWSSMNQAELVRSPLSHEASRHQAGPIEMELVNETTNSNGTRRPSRAGTRTVQVLTEKQLERKRANDRQAQRAIRQRTKDHIIRLERSLRELQEAHDASKRLMASIQQQTRILEEENAYLRTKLAEYGFDLNIGRMQNQRPQESASMTLPVTSSGTLPIDASHHPLNSAPSSQTAVSMTASQSSSSRQGSFQGPPLNMPDANSIPIGPPATNWRPAYSPQAPQSLGGVVQDVPQSQTLPPYNPNERTSWTGPPAPSHPQQQQQQHQQQQQQQQQQQHYGPPPPPPQSFPPSAPPQQTTYDLPPPLHIPPSYASNSLGPATGYSGVHIPTSGSYNGSQQPAFTQPTHYALPPVYAPPLSLPPPPPTMAPPAMPPPTYHPSPTEHHYGPPTTHQPYSTAVYSNG